MLTPAVSAADRDGGAEAASADARQRILQATVQCFRAHGYEKSSMRLIATTANVSQTLLHYHFETKEKLFDAAINDVAKNLFATAATQLTQAASVPDGLADAAGLLYTLFLDNLDTVTFVVEFGAAANHNDFLRTAYLEFREAQRQQFAEMLRTITGADAPHDKIDESVRLMEVVLLGMSMQRPFVSDAARFRADFDSFVLMLIRRLIEEMASR
ncbi:helix-turn-helix domain containing protein [Mycobacterium sp. CVI_P3]|uniref:Helix-turn-helix domain containing protein n=1 Tax=Mycobacterium pinniadriaticum TaxID=2994102 RepID=A0ABT3S9L3_9MYCO|nr:TetR/AcrR family transcriptional regulator [Mycobacterium pinniadriaticum]MCX2929773.1 helix-turn-helix domain containing protein [Mycobacterium pinniadriaticum]MCX2936197.1 helix-turn-helix domain containing protein [Mycobacterium pinniadriaticum]